MNVVVPYYIISHPTLKSNPLFLEIAQVVLSSRPGSHARQPGGPSAEFILSKVEGLRTGVGVASAWESSFSVMGNGLVL